MQRFDGRGKAWLLIRIACRDGFERAAGRTADPSTTLRSGRDDKGRGVAQVGIPDGRTSFFSSSQRLFPVLSKTNLDKNDFRPSLRDCSVWSLSTQDWRPGLLSGVPTGLGVFVPTGRIQPEEKMTTLFSYISAYGPQAHDNYFSMEPSPFPLSSRAKPRDLQYRGPFLDMFFDRA